MPTPFVKFTGFRHDQRWQALVAQMQANEWRDVASRLELRDRQVEDWMLHVPQMVFFDDATADAPLTATNAAQDISGAVSPELPCRVGDIIEADAFFDQINTSAGGRGVGTLLITTPDGGFEQAKQAIHKGATAGDRDTVGQHWKFTVVTAGVHTLQLQGRYDTFAGIDFNQDHTSLKWKVWR